MLADEAEAYVAALRSERQQLTSDAPERTCSSSLSLGEELQEGATAELQEGAAVHPPVPSADVLLTSAAPLRTVADRTLPPIRGSALVERWKRRDGAPISRSSLPPAAFWTPAELERLATLLSDAFDEHGQPAWGLLAWPRTRTKRRRRRAASKVPTIAQHTVAVAVRHRLSKGCTFSRVRCSRALSAPAPPGRGRLRVQDDPNFRGRGGGAEHTNTWLVDSRLDTSRSLARDHALRAALDERLERPIREVAQRALSTNRVV